MNSQILLYGPDTYRLKQALIEIRKRYVEKNGNNVEMVNLDGSEITPSTLESHIFALPLFATKRLIILDSAITSKNQPLIDFLTKKNSIVPSTTLFIINEPTDLRQTKSLEPIFKNSIIKYFPLLNDWETKKYLSRYVLNKNGTINPESLDYLFKNFSNNLWAMTNELNKLLCYSPTINLNSIKKLVIPNEQVVIFDVVDNVLDGNPQKALLISDRLRYQGEPAIFLISLLAGAYKNMISISLCLKENIINLSQIASSLKLHPFVVKKTLPFSRSIPLARLIEIYKNFSKMDADIKRGIIEEDIALDMLIVWLYQARINN